MGRDSCEEQWLCSEDVVRREKSAKDGVSVQLLQRQKKDIFSCGLSEIWKFSVEFSLGLMICQGQKHRGKGIDGLI